jgi:hypothetical protein
MADTYGPITEIDVVIIIADTPEVAKIVERAVKHAGITAPIFGVRNADDMMGPARGAAFLSARSVKDYQKELKRYMDLIEEWNSDYCKVDDVGILRKC